MKTTVQLMTAVVAVAISLHQAIALLSAPMPEFQAKQQTADERSSHDPPQKPSPAMSKDAQNQSAFYTGKPYFGETDQYAFLFRAYDPERNRWTTSDKIGFVDGANNYRYTPVPTSSFDYLGLLNWGTLTNLNTTYYDEIGDVTFNRFSVKTDNGESTIQLLKYVSGGAPGTDYSFNCHGYTFGNSEYWIESSQVTAILAGDGWKKIDGADKSGAKIAVWSGHSAVVTGIKGTTVSEVEGKLGANPGLAKTSPSAQWTGSPTYYGSPADYE